MLEYVIIDPLAHAPDFERKSMKELDFEYRVAGIMAFLAEPSVRYIDGDYDISFRHEGMNH